MMMSKLYLALRHAGVDEAEVAQAAEEVADYQKQLAEIRTDLALVKTLLGVIVAGVTALVVRTFLG